MDQWINLAQVSICMSLPEKAEWVLKFQLIKKQAISIQNYWTNTCISLWRHQMETFSVLQTLCEGNPSLWRHCNVSEQLFKTGCFVLEFHFEKKTARFSFIDCLEKETKVDPNNMVYHKGHYHVPLYNVFPRLEEHRCGPRPIHSLLALP